MIKQVDKATIVAIGAVGTGIVTVAIVGGILIASNRKIKKIVALAEEEAKNDETIKVLKDIGKDVKDIKNKKSKGKDVEKND